MQANHKLTAVLRGRRITAAGVDGDVLTLRFNDGSAMTVRITGSSNNVATGGTVSGVQQAGTTLRLLLESGAPVDIPTAEETSSVMVRGGGGAMEYAD